MSQDFAIKNVEHGSLSGLDEDHHTQYLQAADVADGAWTNLTYENSWEDYTGGYNGGQYRKLANGVVQLRGLIRNGSALNLNAATLPSGFRPPGHAIFNQFSNGGHNRVDVKSDGSILVTNQGTGNPLSWLSLEGIFFDSTGGS